MKGLNVIIYGHNECAYCNRLKAILNAIKTDKEAIKRYYKQGSLDNIKIKDFNIIYNDLLTEDGLVNAMMDGMISLTRIPALVIMNEDKEIFRKETIIEINKKNIIKPQDYLEYLLEKSNQK